MCVPPQDGTGGDFAKEKARLDSLRDVRCPRLMSSAAEYYRNRDWKQTIRVYSEITDLSCDEWNAVYAPPHQKRYINIIHLPIPKLEDLIVQSLFYLMAYKKFHKMYNLGSN